MTIIIAIIIINMIIMMETMGTVMAVDTWMDMALDMVGGTNTMVDDLMSLVIAQMSTPELLFC